MKVLFRHIILLLSIALIGMSAKGQTAQVSVDSIFINPGSIKKFEAVRYSNDTITRGYRWYVDGKLKLNNDSLKGFTDTVHQNILVTAVPITYQGVLGDTFAVKVITNIPNLIKWSKDLYKDCLPYDTSSLKVPVQVDMTGYKPNTDEKFKVIYNIENLVSGEVLKTDTVESENGKSTISDSIDTKATGSGSFWLKIRHVYYGLDEGCHIDLASIDNSVKYPERYESRLLLAYTTRDTIIQTECNSYTLNGQTYTSSGIYTQTLTNVAGCDSIITLNLTINNSNSGDTTAVACNSFTWYGANYTTSGNYAFGLTNVAGCDSIVTLHLTINQSNTSDTTAKACDSFSWYGIIYTISGDQTHTLTNVAGCDSTVTLHLIINNSIIIDTTAIACNSFTWYGTTYTTSGDQTYTLTNTADCDSTITLHLTINNSNAGDTTAVACSSFAWYGTNYTTSGNYAYGLTNAAGCDSTVTLHLTINQSTSKDTIVIANSDNYTLNGQVYSTSGDYTQTIPNAAGCDSVITLHLTINNLPANPGAITGVSTICQGDTATYSIAPCANANSYEWILPSDATIISVATNDTIITVQFGATGGNLIVKSRTSFNIISKDSSVLAIKVNQLPSPVISGHKEVVANAPDYVYSTIKGMASYYWNVSGGTTTSGGSATDDSDTVTWDKGSSGKVSLSYVSTDGCVSDTVTMSVKIIDTPDTTAIAHIDNVIGSRPVCNMPGNDKGGNDAQFRIYITKKNITSQPTDIISILYSIDDGSKDSIVTFNQGDTSAIVKLNKKYYHNEDGVDKQYIITVYPNVTINGKIYYNAPENNKSSFKVYRKPKVSDIE